jgi:hypothetical protein
MNVIHITEICGVDISLNRIASHRQHNCRICSGDKEQERVQIGLAEENLRVEKGVDVVLGVLIAFQTIFVLQDPHQVESHYTDQNEHKVARPHCHALGGQC